MFKQSAERFAEMVASMKQMAAEMHQELEATRNELRRGVLEMPQEAAENTAQMRKVIVDQIEALAELNRIVARHGHGLDVVSTSRTGVHREEEPMLAAASGRGEARSAPRMRDGGSASKPAAAGSRNARLAAHGRPRRFRRRVPTRTRMDGLSDLLSRTDGGATAGAANVPRGRPAQPAAGGNPLESLSLDIGRLMDRNLAAEMWDRYQRGESKAFSKRLYTPAGQKAFDESRP